MSFDKVLHIQTSNICANPNQPRKVFNEDQLQELKNSISEYGILQPITVRKLKEDNYELVAGERRLKAAKLAGLKEIPAIIKDLTEESSAVLAIVENLQREDLNFIEESLGYEKLIRKYNFTQNELAKKLGKSQSTIANKLRILKLPQNIQDKLIDNNLTQRHARALLKLNDEDIMHEVLDKVIKNDLTVKKTEDMVKIVSENESPKKEEDNKKKNKRKIKASVNLKIYLNTLKNAYKAIENTGINANYKEVDKGDYVEVTVKIPKSAK
ncbi:nucleoid occlusion protein [Peptostreptococcaceae bacterium AGR-M142]